MTPPQYPAGPYEPEPTLNPAQRSLLIAEIEQAPAELRKTLAGLPPERLDAPYRNWTIRQIVHHLADSHVNSYIRFKWTLTEDRPTIKPYHEGDWAALPDSRKGDIAPALALFDGLHGRWVQLLRSMRGEDFARLFHHPESGDEITLDAALGYYVWHGQHHTTQIQWLRMYHGW